MLPCGRDQSLAPTIRSLVSNPSFFKVMAWGAPGSMSLLVNGVLPDGAAVDRHIGARRAKR